MSLDDHSTLPPPIGTPAPAPAQPAGAFQSAPVAAPAPISSWNGQASPFAPIADVPLAMQRAAQIPQPLQLQPSELPEAPAIATPKPETPAADAAPSSSEVDAATLPARQAAQARVNQAYVDSPPPVSPHHQPTYSQPFREAPQTPVSPYQPLTPNPAVNPYWAHPELPQPSDGQSAVQQPPLSRQMQQPVSLPPIIPNTTTSYLRTTQRQVPRKKKIILIGVVILAVCIAAAVSYLGVTALMHKQPAQKKTPAITRPTAKQDKPAAEPKAVSSQTTTEVSALTTAAFTAPGQLPAGFTAYDYKTAGVTAYVTEGKACELQFGILGDSQLPGDTPLDIVNRQNATLRAKGNTVSDTQKMQPLVLQDASNPANSFTMESYAFNTQLKNGKKARSYYAVALLKSGARAYVLRTCNSTDQAPSDDTLKPVEAAASTVMLKPAP